MSDHVDGPRSIGDPKADWTPEAVAANANVFLDDFLPFDVAKPITD